MDKIKVNNQIVSMRKFVKQAKIHAINKCTKQIKFLENRKGNEEQMAKTKRKHQRLLEEVNILKKLKPDLVSKSALSKEKDWKAVLAEKNVALEERCFAMLANHPPVQQAVEKFLNDNSELIAKIPELVKQWEEKKSRCHDMKKQKGEKNNSKNPNTLPIGKKNNFHKPHEAQIKHSSSESVENLPESSNLKNIPNDITEQNLMIEKATKMKQSPEKKLLIADDEKSDDSDDSLSDGSEFATQENDQIKDKLLIKNETKHNLSLKNPMQIKEFAVKNESNSAEQNNSKDSNALPIGNKNSFPKVSHEAQIKHSSCESVEDLSDRSNLKNIPNDITEQNMIKKATKNKQSSDNLDFSSILSESPEKQLSVVDNEKSDDSDDSLSDGSDFASQENGQIKDKLTIKNETKQNQSRKNSMQFKEFAVKNKSNLAKKKVSLKKEAVDHGCSDKEEVESKEEENSGKLQDIRSKLLEISMSKTKLQNKPRHKISAGNHQSKMEIDRDNEDSADSLENLNVSNEKNRTSFCTKTENKNKIKAVTILNLSELQDVDEIPIEKSDSDDEDESDEDSGKQRKDPFFLRDGEPVSESEEDEKTTKEPARQKDFPQFRKKPYDNFREHKNNSFPKRKFEKHSANGRNSNFRENSFIKNRKELPFKDNKRNFKRTFDDNSDFRQNKKSKFSSKDTFRSKNGASSFAKNSKEKTFSSNNSRDTKGKGYPPKSSQSHSLKTNNADDKPLHPSWEAKRKLKEAANMKFQGKRMVFT